MSFRLVVAGFAVLVDVEAFVFDTGEDTVSVQEFDAVEESEAAGGSPKVYDQEAEALGAQKAPAVAVEQAAGGGEQTAEDVDFEEVK